MPQGAQNKLVAFALTERDGNTYWNKIGVAFVNRDGSITVNLDALPVSGRLQLREEDRRERGGDDDRGGQGGHSGGRSGHGNRG